MVKLERIMDNGNGGIYKTASGYLVLFYDDCGDGDNLYFTEDLEEAKEKLGMFGEEDDIDLEECRRILGLSK